MAKRRLHAGWEQARYEAENRAWKRTGFSGPDDVKQKVKNLPQEEIVELLREVFLDELASKYFKKNVEFQEALGKDLVVSKEEIVEWLEKIFVSDRDVSWTIDDYQVHSARICPRTMRFITVNRSDYSNL